LALVPRNTEAAEAHRHCHADGSTDKDRVDQQFDDRDPRVLRAEGLGHDDRPDPRKDERGDQADHQFAHAIAPQALDGP
jgi:hypothetical protein